MENHVDNDLCGEYNIVIILLLYPEDVMNNIQELIIKYAQNHDKETMQTIIGEIQGAERIWVAYSPATKNHYMEYHNGIPTAFLFSRPDFCESFREYLATKKIAINTLENKRTERVPMFSDFFRNGIEQIIVDNGQTFIVIEIMDVIKRPDFSTIPEEERPLLNQSLMKCANMFFQCMGIEQDNPNNEKNFMKEIYKAKYLLPIVFDNDVPDGLAIRTINISGAALDLAVIRKSSGGCIIPVFTDWVELGKIDKEKICTGNVIDLRDIEKFCAHGELISINPLGFNMILDKTTVESIKKRFEVPEEKSKGEQMGFFDPANVPEPMMIKLTELLGQTPGISSAYLKALRKDGRASYIVVVDFVGTNPAVFPQIAQQVGPLTGGLALNFIAYNSIMGRAATENTHPFFKR